MPPANYLAFSSFSSWSFAGSMGKASILDKENRLKFFLSSPPLNNQSEAVPQATKAWLLRGSPRTSPSWRLEATQTCPESIWQFRFSPQGVSRGQPRAAARSWPCPGQCPTPCPQAGRTTTGQEGASSSSAACPGGYIRKQANVRFKTNEMRNTDT